MPKITALPQDTAPTTDDLVLTVDVGSGSNRKVSIADLRTLLFNSPTIVSPVITTPPTNVARLTGEIVPYTGKTAPTDWLFCDNTTYSRTTYATLFAIIVPVVGTFTTTIAAPAVVTLSTHGLQTGDQVYLTTTGALPTGLSVNTLYYAVRVDANTFNLSTTRANAYAGTKITTTGTQSGVHTLRFCPYGLGDGSNTFNVPDLRGRIPAGNDSMGGTVASRLALGRPTGVYGNIGASGGVETHTLVTAELAAHTHTENFSSGANNGVTGIAQTANQSSAPGVNSTYTTTSTGSDTAHNNVQPTLLINYLIKT